MDINSNVKQSQRLDSDKINEYAELLRDTKDKDEQNYYFTKIWFAIKKHVIKSLSSQFPTYYNEYYEELLQETAIGIFKEISNFDTNKGSFLTFLRPVIKHYGQAYIDKIGGK